MRITVLAANSVCKTNSLNVKAENGLSLYIEFDERKILFDTGKSDLFIHNAEKMKIDLSQVNYLVISHGHFDHGVGLKHFLKINKKANIFLHRDAANKFYTKIFGFIPYYVGPDQKIIAQNSRIFFIEEDTQIEDKIILIECFPELFPHHEANKELFEMIKNRFITDKFRNELAMLLIENDEIVLFTGCSHSGILNIIEEVKLYSVTMRIKATFGGFPTGQCTRQNNFRHIKGGMCRKIQAMNTGEVIEL